MLKTSTGYVIWRQRQRGIIGAPGVKFQYCFHAKIQNVYLGTGLKFGSRHSPITGGPRLAVNPPNAILNYCFALAESESRLALCACGLDPGIGFVHLDAGNRDSMALDLLETVRPSIEAWLLQWITRESLRRSDFFETGSGNCRLRSGICSQLSETAPTWGRLVAPWAEYVAHMLWSGRSSSDRPATRLTQRHKREAKGRASLPPAIPIPKREHLCRGCGKTIQSGRVNCARCAVDDATKNMRDAARIGRRTANGPEAQAKRAIKARKNALAQHSWKASDQPAWLTQELFEQKIQPRLANVSMSVIRSSLGISKWYASKIRQGYRPHPRHFLSAGGTGWGTRQRILSVIAILRQLAAAAMHSTPFISGHCAIRPASGPLRERSASRCSGPVTNEQSRVCHHAER